ncbi:flagellin N-terminal helical domain-containing protein [Blastococcus sp. SYSU DS1021]
MRDLTVQASNTRVVTDTAAGYIGTEIDELGGALEDIATRTDFNGTKLLLGVSGDPATAAAGDAALSLTFRTGAKPLSHCVPQRRQKDRGSPQATPALCRNHQCTTPQHGCSGINEYDPVQGGSPWVCASTRTSRRSTLTATCRSPTAR